MRKPLVAGNWKMHGSRHHAQLLAEAISEGAKTLDKVDVAIFPSHVHLADIEKLLANSSVKLGAQNFFMGESGALTGEVSSYMLQDYGCSYVLVGHSERRKIFHEDLQLIAEKFKFAVASKLPAILCVGETLQQREQNQTDAILTEQLSTALENVSIDDLSRMTIAYEPVWAIGTGLTATPEQAQAVHAMIREFLQRFGFDIATSTRILYGGSVKGNNAAGLFAMEDIDGALVGGASLEAKSFLEICQAANLSNSHS